MTNYRGNFLYGFIACGPYELVPEFVFDKLFCPSVETDKTPLNRGIVMVASPNPVRASTNILFVMPADRSHVRARIFNAQGRLVNTLYDGPLSRGSHTLTWAPSRNLPGGAYFFRVESEGGLSTNGKVVLVR